MLSLSNKHRYFLYRSPTDMRKGFSGLSGLVRQYMDHELLSGDVFIFLNCRRDRIKLLMWDVTGFALYYKQLEKGTFELPSGNDLSKSTELTRSELAMLLEGIALNSKRRLRYARSC